MSQYKLPVGEVIETGIDFLVEHLSFITKASAKVVETVLGAMESGLLLVPIPVFIVLVGVGVWFLTKDRKLTVGSALGLALIWNMGLWAATVSTLALVVVATLCAIAIGVPLGICVAISKGAYKVVMPILDVMQTMPAFVYLIPAIPFFGLGKTAAIFSTVIFSMPPAIRFTCLGIRQIPAELVECSTAFGATRMQRLFKLDLPLASPTIMAGINQTVMLALSMVVIASMIGAKGLGGEVWKAIQRLQMGRGFEAGIAIVIVAMILDRVLQKLGTRKEN
ncbi:MAG: proline/glycine betaine ABC transporter permease [Desulfomicrobium sp.]|nr:proline/glycine betaine ABC transporter permease [Pseudomonadota bacterium]MBV1713045.1 proline/glycine betaine ABC transporter permease [Desulfomicrobium sp.]MBU4572015.1 proline/glycine betaine ABC transporter permease [Pseudomonadota bacterium]MBU4596164.1 proline/glycine betaine ABC transporter permease [Pseudomonadota bacterium]MBV1721468.1 proline/glycine betaine ABC transporter permease [Desulfomicrobium sp.]